MLPEKRRMSILKIIEGQENITSREIAQMLKISKTTLWRDLRELALSGKLQLTHGGAILHTPSDQFEFLFSTRLRKNIELKRCIAEKAASLVDVDDVIAIDTGTTATLLASALKARKRITVLTTSLAVVQELVGVPTVYTVLLGGDVREETMSTAGSLTLQYIRSFRVNKYFIGAAAIDPLRGTQDAFLFERDIKQALASVSDRRIVVADSSKFGATSLFVVVPLKDIHVLVTDSGVSNTHVKRFTEAGIEVMAV